MKSALRGALSLPWRGVRALCRRPEAPHRPDLGDRAFLASLLPASALLAEARRLAVAGQPEAARRVVVEHFVHRASPAFFVPPAQVATLAARLRHERPHWVAAQRARLDDERRHGLRVYGQRHHRPGAGFGWVGVPQGPGEDDLHSAQPHRFGMLPRLALAAHHGEDTLPVIDAMLSGWIAAVDAAEPECYHSVLAVMMRLLAIGWTFTFVAGLPAGQDGDTRERVLFTLLKIAAADVAYVAPQLGDAYPNNHLLADGFIGWYGGLMYPEFTAAATLPGRGEAIFVPELMRQFLADGGSFEHSLHYHEMGCEMALAWLLLSRRNGLRVEPQVADRLRAMLAVQAALGGPEAEPLMLGNGTDDPLFPLDAGHGWANGALREALRALFDPALPPATTIDAERAFWMLGGDLSAASARPDESRLPEHFAEAGFEVRRDPGLDARLVLRSGPREGVALSAGHAHADLLGLYLWQSGVPLIVDAGTFSYRLSPRRWPPGEPSWRRHFAGPRAHNGLVLGADPLGEMQGDFRNRDLPCRVAERGRASGGGLHWVEFEVVGGPSAGQRRGLVHVAGAYWLVYDDLSGDAPPGAEMRLQFAIGSRLQVVDRHVDASFTAARARVTCGPGLGKPAVLEGSLSPLGGWVSMRYAERQPAPQLCVPLAAARGPFVFLVQAGAQADLLELGVEGDDRERMIVIEGPGYSDRLCLRRPGGPAQAQDAALVRWTRRHAGGVEERRASPPG